MTATLAEAVDRTAARAGRRLAVETLFESDFGQRTPQAVLDRKLETDIVAPEAARVARSIITAVTTYRDRLDAQIEAAAPVYPVVQLGRIDRALLRSGLGEMLHSATPTRVVIAEWVALARIYSGEPARRLVNGVLGRIARETGADVSSNRPEGSAAKVGRGEGRRDQGGRLDVRATQEDRRRTAGRGRGSGNP